MTSWERLRATARLRFWAFAKIPLIWFLRPIVVELTRERSVVRVPLGWRTRNHMGSMYFGALCTGADAAAALLALEALRRERAPYSILFKEVRGEFVKRAEGDVDFTCEQGGEITDLLRRAREREERLALPIRVTATVPSLSANEPVALFEMTLSAKKR